MLLKTIFLHPFGQVPENPDGIDSYKYSLIGSGRHIFHCFRKKILQYKIFIGRLKSNCKGLFFENYRLEQFDVVFDSDLNGRNFSSLAQPDEKKNIIYNFSARNDVTAWAYFLDFFGSNENSKKSIILFRHSYGFHELA